MKPIEIVVVGTTGSGKTTLIKKLKKELEIRNKTVEVVHEVARESPWAINEEADFMAQRWVFHQQILKELEAEYKNPDIILCDRGLVDNICYAERICDMTYPYPIIEFLQLYEISRFWSQKYDHIIYMPFNPTGLTHDGIRSTNVEFAQDIDKRINKILKEFKLDNIKYKKSFSIQRFCNKVVPKSKNKRVTKRK